MTPTTTHALSAAFVIAFHAITPRHVDHRATRWKYTPGTRERGQAGHLRGTTLRSFDLVWEPGVESRLWYGNGEAYTARMRVAVSYATVPPEEIEHMVTADGVDLMRALRQLGEPTVQGLSHTDYEGCAVVEIDDNANAYAEHIIRVHWAQDTDSEG